MSNQKRLSRRSFVKAAAIGAAAPLVVPASVLGRDGKDAPSNRVTLGCIGVGGRGWRNMQALMRHGGQVVAVCDVRNKRRGRVKELAKLPDKSVYTDYRDLMARKDIDAVMCATPDHWHVLIGIAAITSGKDLYLEKPLGITVEEGKAIRKTVKQSDRIFMHGTEQRAMPEVRKVCELVRNGRLGKLHTVKVACPGARRIGKPKEEPIPKGLDYDFWLGPLPKKPYCKKRVRPSSMFWISDNCPSGYVCGWGVHHLDFAQWALGTDDTGPVEVDGWALYPKPGDLCDTALDWKIEYKYANGVKMIFTHGSRNPQGVRFEGTEGWIFKSYREPAQASDPKMLDSKIKENEVHLYKADGDDKCFLECVKSRKETCSPIEVAHRSSTIGYIGDISARLGRKLAWDPVKEEFKGDTEANKMLSRPMRAPWKL